MDEYFQNYEDLDIHDIMLRDHARVETYRNAILGNKEFFHEKIVIDVGAGTGILSLICAQAGARIVYAVEASNVAKLAERIVEDNEFSNIVKVHQCKIEDFKLPEKENKVDIIVSEWMGFYLLHEGMLDSVIYARDNFLKPNGLIFPSHAQISIAPCSLPSHFEMWENFQGVKMTKFAEAMRLHKSSKPEIMCVKKEHMLHEGIPVTYLNLNDVTVDELDNIVYKDVIPVQNAGKFQGFCIWFDVDFEFENSHDSYVLSTSPCKPETHWKQCVVILPEYACSEVEIDEPIAFEIKISRNELNSRRYNIAFELLDPNTTPHPLPCNCYMTKCILTKAHLQTLTNGN